MDLQEKKPSYLSKTLWVNVLVAAAAFIPGLGDKMVENPELAVTIIAGINVLLRVVTKSKIELW